MNHILTITIHGFPPGLWKPPLLYSGDETSIPKAAAISPGHHYPVGAQAAGCALRRPSLLPRGALGALKVPGRGPDFGGPAAVMWEFPS